MRHPASGHQAQSSPPALNRPPSERPYFSAKTSSVYDYAFLFCVNAFVIPQRFQRFRQSFAAAIRAYTGRFRSVILPLRVTRHMVADANTPDIKYRRGQQQQYHQRQQRDAQYHLACHSHRGRVRGVTDRSDNRRTIPARQTPSARHTDPASSQYC